MLGHYTNTNCYLKFRVLIISLEISNLLKGVSVTKEEFLPCNEVIKALELGLGTNTFGIYVMGHWFKSQQWHPVIAYLGILTCPCLNSA